jgi:hypothetical protein
MRGALAVGDDLAETPLGRSLAIREIDASVGYGDGQFAAWCLKWGGSGYPRGLGVDIAGSSKTSIVPDK